MEQFGGIGQELPLILRGPEAPFFMPQQALKAA